MNRKKFMILLAFFLTQYQYNAKRVQAYLDLDLDINTAEDKVCRLSEKEGEAKYEITFRVEGDCSKEPLKCRPYFSLVDMVPNLFSHFASGDNVWCTCSSSHVKDMAGHKFEFDFRIIASLSGQEECSSRSCWNMYSDAMLHDKRAANSSISGSGQNRLNMPDHWDGECVESSLAENSGLVALPLTHNEAVVKNVRVVPEPVIDSEEHVEDIVETNTDVDGCYNDAKTRLDCMLAVKDITGDNGTGDKKGRWRSKGKKPEQRQAFKDACNTQKCCSTHTPKGAYLCAPKRGLPEQPALIVRSRDTESIIPPREDIRVPVISHVVDIEDRTQSSNELPPLEIVPSRVITQCKDAGQCLLALAYPYPLQHATYVNLKGRAKRKDLEEWSAKIENRCPDVTEGDRVYFGVADAMVKYVFANKVEATVMRQKHIAEDVNMRFFNNTYGSHKPEHRELSRAVSEVVGNAIAKIKELEGKTESAASTEIEALETENCRLVEETV